MSEKSNSRFVIPRRTFLRIVGGGAAATATAGSALSLLAGCGDNITVPIEPPGPPVPPPIPAGVYIPEVRPGEDIFAYIDRVNGSFDQTLYQQIVGAANPFKEGDELIAVAAANEASRLNARVLLGNTTLGALFDHPLYSDALYDLILSRVEEGARTTSSAWTMSQFKDFLLTATEEEIKGVRDGLSSDIIGCAVKLMSNEELIAVGQKVFNPLPGSNIGARGYMGARIQPNSPTDNLDDIRWQVFNGWAYAVGDVVLGTNPVSSDLESVTGVELALEDILETFGMQDAMPHCVLSHIDIQAAAEQASPGATALWFQSLGGTESANATFDVSIQGMLDHAAVRTGKYGLYFETGQGADATNGHAWGFDMVVHESRKYGFARVLAQEVAAAQTGAGQQAAPWVHLNDVAGFIGPEIFRSKEQLVRCCLEDIVMGKLHGVMIGLDICSTLHMDVSLDDLDWCIDQIMPANPGYLMGLPTKNDPMLSYLTTGYQDHVRVREQFGYKVNDAMWEFFKTLGVIDAGGQPTAHFGQPSWVYLQYLRAKGDGRTDQEIMDEAQVKMAEIRGRGVFIAEGFGQNPWDLDPALNQQVHDLYDDAKISIWSELDAGFVDTVPDHVWLDTQSQSREDYILHPATGERLSDPAVQEIEALRQEYGGQYDVQIVISDGLNARAIADSGHLEPYLQAVRSELAAAGYKVAPKHVVLTAGRVRAGYHLGEVLFGDGAAEHRGIVHVIGERPGTGHHNFSVYITGPQGSVWSNTGRVDHDITRVVSGISDTALSPLLAATDTVQLITDLWNIDVPLAPQSPGRKLGLAPRRTRVAKGVSVAV